MMSAHPVLHQALQNLLYLHLPAYLPVPAVAVCRVHQVLVRQAFLLPLPLPLCQYPHLHPLRPFLLRRAAYHLRAVPALFRQALRLVRFLRLPVRQAAQFPHRQARRRVFHLPRLHLPHRLVRFLLRQAAPAQNHHPLLVPAAALKAHHHPRCQYHLHRHLLYRQVVRVVARCPRLCQAAVLARLPNLLHRRHHLPRRVRRFPHRQAHPANRLRQARFLRHHLPHRQHPHPVAAQALNYQHHPHRQAHPLQRGMIL